MTIKIITLHQPWASLIALRLKQYETRSFRTQHRGLIAIHAAKRPFISEDGLTKLDKEANNVWLKALKLAHESGLLTDQSRVPFAHQLPLGSIVAIAELTDCQIMGNPHPQLMRPDRTAFIKEQTPLELAVGDWQPGRYAWKLQNILTLPQSIACRGYQGMRNLPAELELAINQQINPGYSDAP